MTAQGLYMTYRYRYIGVDTMFKGKRYLEFIVLYSLSKGKKSGYALMKQIGSSTGSKPSPGSMYPLLTTLRKRNFVSMQASANKKIYSLTAKGKKAFLKMEKNKHQFVNHVKGQIKVLESITGQKHGDILRMFDKLKKGKMPFLWLFPDAIKLRKTLLSLVERVQDEKRQEKVKKIIRRTVMELKKI